MLFKAQRRKHKPFLTDIVLQVEVGIRLRIGAGVVLGVLFLGLGLEVGS